MANLTAYGELLAASTDDRTLTYRLLPYGEEGRTNRGRVTAGPGSVDVPDDVSTLVANLDHDRNQPAALFESVDEDEGGLIATLRALPTTRGNDLLAEAAAGVRRGISVELGRVHIRAGQLVSSVLRGAGALIRPAFPSAQLLAGDVGPEDDDTDPDQEDTMPRPRENENQDPAVDDVDDDQEDDVNETEDDDAGEDSDLEAGDATPSRRQPARALRGGAGSRSRSRRRPRSADEFFDTLAAAHAGGEADTELLAALDEGVEADLISTSQPRWLGEIWSSRTHRQRFIPLFTNEPLNSLRGVGWKFAETTAADTAGTLATPTVEPYAGYPAQPASTEVKTEAVDWKADRVAGANEFDREFIDFDTPGFWRGFYREAGNDASRKLDAAARDHMLDPTNHVTLTDAVTPAAIDAKTALSLIVAGVLAIQERAMPDFAIIGTDLYRPMLMTERQAALEYLSVALDLDPAEGRLDRFRFVPSAAAGVASKVLVGASESQTFSGPKTVRARTVNISNGGVQDGLFAYYKAFTGDRYSKVLVSKAAV